MTDSNESPPNSSSTSRRRSSFAGQTFADLFGTGRTRPSVSSESNPAARPQQTTGPITTAAAQAHRRMSISTLGLSGAQNLGPFRRDSQSSANSSAIDESAVEDDVGSAHATPSTPFGRRASFGARALRDVKSNTGQGGSSPGGATDKSNGRSSMTASENVTGAGDNGKKTGVNAPTTAKGRGLSSASDYSTQSRTTSLTSLFDTDSGYNWADNFRNRAERSASINSMSGSPTNAHVRAKSVATMQPPPVSEVPKANVPDHFQERILKGDFYMD